MTAQQAKEITAAARALGDELTVLASAVATDDPDPKLKIQGRLAAVRVAAAAVVVLKYVTYSTAAAAAAAAPHAPPKKK